MVLLFHILVVGGLATSKKTGFVVTVVVHGRIGPVSCLAFGHHGFAHGLTGCLLYTFRAHETDSYLVCRLLLEKKNNKTTITSSHLNYTTDYAD